MLAVLGSAGPAAQARGSERAELAYAHDGRIYSLAADGSARRLLAAPKGPYSSFEQPVWSPDGSMLAFVRVASGGDGGSQILVRDASGTRALTKLSATAFAFSPAWSPDGSRIAFSRFIEHKQRAESSIVVAAADGSGARAVVAASVGERLATLDRPTWLPDGRTLAYIRSALDGRSYFRPSVLTVPAAGGVPTRLLRDAQSVTWSPDGSRIAFSSVRDRIRDSCGSDECSYAGELYVAAADGGRARRLTRNRGNDDEPRWAPDGSRIVFSSDRNFPEGDSPELYSVDPAGECLTWLTNGVPGSDGPAWRPGASGSTDPGRCGAGGRRPLVEVEPDRRSRGLFWLGLSYRGLLLSELQPGRTATYVNYDDCGRYDPRRCPPAVLLTDGSVCGGPVGLSGLLDVAGPGTAHTRGAVFAYQSGVEGATLLSGSTFAGVQLERWVPNARRHHLAIVRDLVRIGRGDRPGSKLPPPRLSARGARVVRAALAARRAEPSLRRAARKLGIAPWQLASRVRLARQLQKLGGIRTTRCG